MIGSIQVRPTSIPGLRLECSFGEPVRDRLQSDRKTLSRHEPVTLTLDTEF
jgi:hypothetical protein